MNPQPPPDEMNPPPDAPMVPPRRLFNSVGCPRLPDNATHAEIAIWLKGLAAREQSQPYGGNMDAREWAATCLESAADELEAVKDSPAIQTKQMGDVWAATDGARSCLGVSEQAVTDGIKAMQESAVPAQGGEPLRFRCTDCYRKYYIEWHPCQCGNKGPHQLVVDEPPAADSLRDGDAPTVDEALQIAQRFIDGHFDNPGEKPRMSIPANPKRDDDIRLTRFIERVRTLERELAELRAIFPKIAAALNNGSFCSADCSVEFLSGLPREVSLVITAAKQDSERLAEALRNLPCYHEDHPHNAYKCRYSASPGGRAWGGLCERHKALAEIDAARREGA